MLLMVVPQAMLRDGCRSVGEQGVIVRICRLRSVLRALLRKRWCRPLSGARPETGVLLGVRGLCWLAEGEAAQRCCHGVSGRTVGAKDVSIDDATKWSSEAGAEQGVILSSSGRLCGRGRGGLAMQERLTRSCCFSSWEVYELCDCFSVREVAQTCNSSRCCHAVSERSTSS